MEHEQQQDELLVKYLLNETTPDEDLIVEAWVSNSAENKIYFESLATSLRLIETKHQHDHVDIEQEWKQFCSVRQAKSLLNPQLNTTGSNNDQAKLLTTIKPRNFKLLRLSAAIGVAASLIFLLFNLTDVFESPPNSVTIANIPTTSNNSLKDLNNLMIAEENTTTKIKRIILPDNSVVWLHPRSSITYKEPSGTQRHVALKGIATFEVSKNRKKPFSVYSGEIFTTALGTRFTINATPSESKIYVFLSEGKIVVRASSVSNPLKDVYMDRGQELVYDVHTKLARLRTRGQTTATALAGIKKEISLDNPSLPKQGKEPWFMFNNQSLKETFDVLAAMYETKIIYSKKEVDKMYFIGSFNKSDSLPKILKEIAFINNLQVVRDSNSYRIIKKK